MAVYATIGYKFPLGAGVSPDGSVLLASTMTMHQLERRRLDQHEHLQQRLFDPQLYLAGLGAVQCKRDCAKLASYPWFGVEGLQSFDSGQHQQKGWLDAAEDKIAGIWPNQAPSDGSKIRRGVEECISFQQRLGCWGVILPSPLTEDPSTSYDEEERWLDAALDYVDRVPDFNLPKFATVAVSDLCLRMKPQDNPLLPMIVDSVTSREGLDGVYLVVEQASEPADGRYCGNARTLASVLHLVHAFANDAEMRVGVNFLGPYGLVCSAAGAEWWATNWYQSLRRLCLADKLRKGRARPIYWSYPCAIDIHLDKEFDELVKSGHLPMIRDETAASESLLRAAERGRRVSQVPAWVYRQSNIAATQDHYLLSCIRGEGQHAKAGQARLDKVHKWLERAVKRAQKVEHALGPERKTQTQHVPAWLDALEHYRTLHNV